ncbi:MAG: CDP-diacylglycerol--serine O-phosphatidyltransferase [Candidatus Sumerlaeota bacterium]|nr:CDP-diacylglycerol--serine O-phosphatidyltransferase [Candidatus Sumerlaeota bacterium]
MRRVYIIPNLITAASMMCGMLAIFEAMEATAASYENACYLILAATILDFLDGKVARMTRATSSFGLQFDSLSDLVAFGVAPAVLLYNVLTHSFSLTQAVASGVCVPYAICGALRLGRFNVQAMQKSSSHFTGLPIPGAAMAMVGLSYMLSELPEYEEARRLALCVILALGYLMVSRIHYPSLKKVAFRRRKSFDMLVAMVLIAGLSLILKNHFHLLMATGAFAYMLVGPVLRLYYLVSGRSPLQEETLAPAGGGISPASHPDDK